MVKLGIYLLPLIAPFFVCVLTDCLTGDKEMLRFLAVFLPFVLLIVGTVWILVT